MTDTDNKDLPNAQDKSSPGESRTTTEQQEAPTSDPVAAASPVDNQAGHRPRIRVPHRGELKRLRTPARTRVRPRPGVSSEHGGEAATDISARSETGRPESEGKMQLPQRSDSRRAPLTIQELLGDSLRTRAESADPKLKALLQGSLLIRFVNSGQKFLFAFNADDLEMGYSDKDTADCVMNVSEQNLLRVASGDLNPQIAMLSDKIRVSGNLSIAVYWFNLIAPRSASDRD